MLNEQVNSSLLTGRTFRSVFTW